jgi:SUN domain-containing protein 1/2
MPPEVALSPDNTPGNCYAFAGDHGSIGVRLIAPVRPTHVTVDHLSRAIAFSVASATVYSIVIR